MAIGTWDDFRSKWGFNEGASVENRDYEARALILAELNEMTGVKDARIRAIAWDRSRVHNPCLIVILPNADGKADDALLADWKAGKLQEVELPESVSELLDEIVDEAYAGERDLG